MLGLAILAGSAAGVAEAGESFFLSHAGEISATADPRPVEDAWEPCPFLRYDEGGFPGLTRSRSGDRPLSDPFDDAGPLPGFGREPFDWREAAPRERSAFRVLLEPLDAALGLATLRGSWGKGGSEVSVSTDLSSWVDSLGAPLGGRVSLGLHVDMLGFEEGDGGRLPLIEPRHVGSRAAFVSTGVGLSLGF